MSENNEGVLFKSALGGYKKSDVNTYIRKISEGFSVKEREYAEKLSKTERRVKEAESKKAEAYKKLDEMTIEAYSEKLRADENEKKLEEIKKELAKCSSMLDELACEVYKAEKTEKSQAADSSLLENAEREAELILRRAKEKAERLISEAGEGHGCVYMARAERLKSDIKAALSAFNSEDESAK